jgi:hypothetical protein
MHVSHNPLILNQYDTKCDLMATVTLEYEAYKLYGVVLSLKR